MQTLDFFTYFSGMSAAFYMMACVVCGLQLCFSIFPFRANSDLILSRSLGIILLLSFCSTVCYVLENFFPERSALFLSASTIDFLVFAGLAFWGCLIYSDNRPDRRTLIALAIPFLAIVVINIAIPASRRFLLDAAMLILIAEYVFYAFSIQQRERALDYLYSDPDSHSLKWIRTITLLCIGWLVIRFFFFISNLIMWYDSALYIYLAVLVIFSYSKVSGYGNPVKCETREQIEKMEWAQVRTTPDLSIPLQQGLIRLLEDQEIFLNSDLTIDDVAMKLGTTPRYLSIMLHNDMNTSFTQIINKYRVERAMFLLKTTDEKVAYVGCSCGFNSQQVFNRSFLKVCGQTPSEWRKSAK